MNMQLQEPRARGRRRESGRRAAAGLIGVKAANAVLGIVTVVLFARWMGADEYGLYVVVITAVQLIAVPLHFGLPTLLVRETAILVQSGELGLLRGLIRWSYALIAGGSALVMLLGLAVLAASGVWNSSDALSGTVVIGLMAALIVPMVALNKLARGLLNGLRHTVASQVPDGLIRPGLVLFPGCVAFWVGWMDATSMVGLYLLAAVLAAGVGIAMTRRALPEGVATSTPAYTVRPWLSSLLPLTAVAAVQVFKNQTDIVMIVVLTEFAQVGQYKVAAQMATLPLILQVVVNAVLAPRIAAAHAAGNRAHVQRQVIQASRWVLVGTMAGLLPLAVYGTTLIPVVFGIDYLPSYQPFLLLMFGVLFTAGSGASVTLLNMCGHERQTMRLAVGWAAANVILNLMLIPFFGMVGAACATAITTIGMQVGALRACHRNLGYVLHVFGKGAEQ